jgi:glutathione S-transferase
VIKLYYYPSYASMVPHMLMEEIGLDYELVFTDRYANAHKSAAFLRLNPNGLIPTFEEDDLVLYETAAICLHLVDRHPAARLAPAVGSADRAHFYKWLMWLATALHPALSMYLHPDKWASEPSMVTELKASAEAKVSDLLNVIDAELGKGGGPWLLGEAYSAVDPYALMLCRWSRGMPRPASSWPHFGPYARRILERPAIRRALRQEYLAEPWI